jgi:hypothetical protein
MKISGLVWVALALTAAAGCSTSSASSDVADARSGDTAPATGDDSSVPASGDASSGPPATNDASSPPKTGDGSCASAASKHRAQPVACAASGSPADGGAPCTTAADCDDAGQMTCLQGRCTLDQCTTDADCPGGGVCSCVGATRGYGGASPANVCVPANCRTDADCGGGYCSPTVSTAGPFYGIQGYYCHTCSDACTNDSDCADAGVSCFGGPFCAYDPTVGRWACGTSCAAG